MTRERARATPRVKLTRRGIGILAAGSVVVALGLTFAMPDLIALGTAAILLVAGAAGAMGASRLDRGRAALAVTRRITPNPAVRGQTATTNLTVRAERPSARVAVRLAGLRLGEQAAHELCDAAALRARITTDHDRISIRYTITPRTRGRWTLGPLLASRVDVFGLVQGDQELGAGDVVSVWPRTVDLRVRARGVFGDRERTGSGAHLASTDDSTLRDYVAGDDPRRVHWPSAARHGQLMVRADESGGLPPVTVLVDRGLLPHPDAPTRGQGEWAIECAASIAVSLARAGHPVRIVPTQTAATRIGPFTSGRGQETSADLLNDTLDLWGHPSPQDTHRATAATLGALRRDRVPGELTLAVLGPLLGAARDAAAALTIDATAWAIVVDDRPAAQSDAQDTVAFLRERGWHSVVAGPATTIENAWLLLVGDNR